MKLKLRPSMMKIRRQSVKWLIVHHTAEMYPAPSSKIDNAKYQLPGLISGVHQQKTGDINYHYVIDKIKEDYQPIVTRPIAYLCDWDDIDTNINSRAVHIAVMGSYDVKIPTTRLLEILAYRLLNPMLKLFSLAPNRIKFHNEVSNIEDLTCPGEFFDKGKLTSLTRRFVIK